MATSLPAIAEVAASRSSTDEPQIASKKAGACGAAGIWVTRATERSLVSLWSQGRVLGDAAERVCGRQLKLGQQPVKEALGSHEGLRPAVAVQAGRVSGMR